MANIVMGMPPVEFYGAAWASEPLTMALQETDIMFALPMADEKMSYVAKNEDAVVGQCSANLVEKYWTHLSRLDISKQNLSTQTFVKIHQKAVVIERLHLEQNGLSIGRAWHNAGLAVLPAFRGRKIAQKLLGEQIKLGVGKSMTVLFYEATNSTSAAIAQKAGLIKLAEFKYSDLAVELKDERLHAVKDSFSVWCIKI